MLQFVIIPGTIGNIIKYKHDYRMIKNYSKFGNKFEIGWDSLKDLSL